MSVRADRRNEAGSRRVGAPADRPHHWPNSWEPPPPPPTIAMTTSSRQSLLCESQLGTGHRRDDDDDDDDKQRLQKRDAANQCVGGRVGLQHVLVLVGVRGLN